MQHEFLRWTRVQSLTGLSRSTIWRLEKVGQFPARRKLSANTVGWSASELQDWMASRCPVGVSALQGAHDR
ncbi:MAG TPA: AlpA family phage regulatory protein [Burkholderiales bacterium]|jgi:predicted DNA-binding transcriptional regulator AlpA